LTSLLENNHASHMTTLVETEMALGGAAGTSSDDGVAAAVESLDGSERKLLLSRLANSNPEVVAAGFAWLAEYHSANRERRRINRNQKAKERRRRRRVAEARKQPGRRGAH
jgi:hypothetical protein